jgi:hypothetical protein
MVAEWSVTVVLGKATAALRYWPESARALAELRLEVSQRFGVEPQHQKLLCKGRVLAGDGPSPLVADKCKIMVLASRQLHAAAATKGSAKSALSVPGSSDDRGGSDGSIAATRESQDPPPPMPVHSSFAVSQSQIAAPSDATDDDEDSVRVQLLRGKSILELVMLRDSRVLDIKVKASALLALSSPHALRLIVKGKTPDDSATLEDVARGARLIKCMVLLQAQQYTVLEKEGEFRDLMNELAQLQTERRRVEKQMARNFTSRDESLFQLSTLADRAEHVCSNLELLELHLAPSAGAAAGKRVGASAHTVDTLKATLEEARVLATAARDLLERHSTF